MSVNSRLASIGKLEVLTPTGSREEIRKMSRR